MSQREGLKRASSNNRSASGDSDVRYYAKRSRYEENGQQQVVPSLDGQSSASEGNTSGSASRTQSPVEEGNCCPTWLSSDANLVIPKPGTPVDRKVVKRVGGKYLLGPKIGNGPVECINQYLARLENTEQFFHLKILVLDTDPQNKKTVEGEKQAKLLLHSEYQLLKMLENEEGVIRSYDLFMDSAFEEEPVQENGATYVYTGRVKRRIVLAVDCLAPHDFDDKSNAYINLQQYVIREKNLSEMKTLLVFYEIIKIVENLHKKNIVHRDLKLRNIILNTASNRVVVTNFCLGKQLLNEDDYLHDQRGSPAYISPDVLSASHQRPYKGKPSDIWALGVVLYTMLYSQFPFFETKPAALFKRIKSVDYKIPKHTKVSEGTQYLIKNMLLLNPDDRLTATEIREQIERMISNKRQFFLRIDQMVPEIDVQSRAKGRHAQAESAKTKRISSVAVTAAPVATIQEPMFALSRERFTDDVVPSGAGTTASASAAADLAMGSFPDGLFYFPKREGGGRSRMAVQHLSNDARLLTGDEWGQYSRIIREHGGTGTPPGTGAAARTAASSPSTPSASGVGVGGNGSNSGTGVTNGNSSTMSSRLAARNNAMRVRQMYTGGSPRVPQEGARGSTASPPPLRTSDPAIVSAVAAARAASGSARSGRGGGSGDWRMPADYRLFQSLFPRPSRHSSSSASAALTGTASTGASANSVHGTSSTVSPSGASTVTIRLRPHSQDNLNQMLQRIDRLLTNRLDDAAREFCTTVADMYSRGRIRRRGEGDQQGEFTGVLTTELAEQIGDWLLQDCAEAAIVRDIFSESTVNAKEKVVELLRRCGMQVDIGPTIEIKRAQNFDSVIIFSYILQAAGYSCSYFA